MNKLRLTIIRLKDSGHQTLGTFTLHARNKRLFSGVTLELPWRGNRRRVSCIPTGLYQVHKRKSQRHGEHFMIEDVEKRSWILIHAGNYAEDTQGCILVGRDFQDINNDGEMDITSSKATLKKLLNLIGNQDVSLRVLNDF